MQDVAFPEKYETLSDEQLVKLCNNGVQEAFSALSVRYIFVIRNKTAEIYHSGLENDDLFQEGMIGLHNAVKTFDPYNTASFRTYAGVCIRNHLISVIRAANSNKNRINSYTVPLSDQTDEPASAVTEPENVVVAKENVRELWVQIEKKLSDTEKQVLFGHLDGRSYSEIANKLGITAKSCDNAMQRVRHKLKILK
ncbi:MAG: sigma-70 family RNA polymerase sigma factor [Clostridia bacterium]|nr:sigma-70 family RNA polymerase sigma factor [Clostridia bacterium]